MLKVIGIDLGGTNLRLSLVSKEGRVMGSRRSAIGKDRSEGEIIGRLVEQIRLMTGKIKKGSVGAVGMGVPGIVSAEEGRVYASPHFPAWSHFHLAKRLKTRIKIPVFIDNDANMAALGERWMGAARGFNTFLMVTLGTGIGGALVIDSKVFHGNHGFAGEIGHMVINAEGPRCACGSRGCFETYASATGLSRMAGEFLSLRKLSSTDKNDLAVKLARLARRGHQTAIKTYRQFGYYLGIGLASLINATGIQRVVLGGGMMGAKDLFLYAAREELKRRTYAQTYRGIKICHALRGDDGGILGAALTAYRSMESSSS